MSTKIDVRADGTLTVKWTGAEGGGSLFQLAAEGNVKHVNALGAEELWAVLVAVKSVPFPAGQGRAIYERALWAVRNTPAEVWPDGQMPALSLGELRRGVVLRAGEGFNAPTDSYLRIAYAIHNDEDPDNSWF